MGVIEMQGRLNTGQGSVSISSEVIAQYAGTSALECFGIVGMATVSMTDGLVKLLRGSSLTKGIKVSINNGNSIELDFHIIVSYGVSIKTVTDNLIYNVSYKVKELTGMNIDKIRVYVEGVRVID